MKKLILFGDSNTYGYDPRGFLGGRYPEEIRWTTHVKKALENSYEIIEEGMNGRMLPELGHGHFTTLLQGLTSDVAATLKRLDDILDYVNQHCLAKFILIAPPYISAIEPELKLYHDCSVEMNEGYMKLANEHSINVINAGAWNIEMGYDGVHFSIDGHAMFGKALLNALEEIL